METLGDRVRQARELRGLNQTEGARSIGIKQSSLSEIESGITKDPAGETLMAMQRAWRVRAEWIKTGQLPKEPEGGAALLARDAALPYLASDNIVAIPVFDVAASMGLGAAMPEHETVVDHLRLDANWVRRNLPSVSSTLNLSVISAYGDSMAPTFHDGDILLVDRGISTIRLDAVYVLDFHHELYIKRIQRRPDGSIAIISDNKVYEPIVVPPGEKETVRVLGRVLWAWNGKKL